MKWLLLVCACLLLLGPVVAVAGFNVDVFDHDGNLLTSSDLHFNGSWVDDPEGSADYELGEDGARGELDYEEEPESGWEWDEMIRRYNHLVPIHPLAIAVPLNFPTRGGKPETSPQDRIYPILRRTFQLEFPQCLQHQVEFSVLGEDAGFHPRQVVWHPNPPKKSLTLIVTNVTSDLRLMVYVACMDVPIRGRTFRLHDPEITYVLAIRPNFQNFAWFEKTTALPGAPDQYHVHVNVTHERETAYWYNPAMFWVPINALEGVPDQLIPFQESDSLNLTFESCGNLAMLLHPFKPYRSPDGRAQILPVPGHNTSYHVGFFDVTSGTGAVYMGICMMKDGIHDRDQYTSFRANFRDMSFSATSAPFYDMPITIYPNMVLYRWPQNFAFVHTTKYEQVFPLRPEADFVLANVSISAGLAGWVVSFVQEHQDAATNLTNGETVLPEGRGHVRLNVSYDGAHLAFTLLNITEDFFGQYTVVVRYNDGTGPSDYWYRQIFIRPHLRPQFFNPDVKAPYEHRFLMPWDRNNPQHRAMALRAVMDDAAADGDDAPASKSSIPPGTQFFFLVCAVAILGLSVLVMLLAMRYVRPIVISPQHRDPLEFDLEDGTAWIRRPQRPWTDDTSSLDSALTESSV